MRPVPCLALALAASLAARRRPRPATDARVRSLGGLADAFEDDSDALRWPGSLIDYAGQASLGLSEDQDGGAPARSATPTSASTRPTAGACSASPSPTSCPRASAAGTSRRATRTGSDRSTAALDLPRHHLRHGGQPGRRGRVHAATPATSTAGASAPAPTSRDDVYVDAAAEIMRSELEYDDDAERHQHPRAVVRQPRLAPARFRAR